MKNNKKLMAALAMAALAVFVLAVETDVLITAIGQDKGAAMVQPTEEVGAVSSAAPEPEPDTSYDISLVFGGDINLDDHWYVMQYAAEQENGVKDCIDSELLKEMNAADLCSVNNEFAFSDGGTPMDGKTWTFRSDPVNVSVLKTMGVDVVTLANNHIYDYGADAFADTLDTLTSAGIGYVGAGKDLAEAASPYYKTIQGKTIAVVNATRAEKNIMTPEATETSSGVLRCYETERFVQEIEEAKKHADFVICAVHWGTEYSEVLEEAQTQTAREYIDAGADVIVGSHTHCLQGIEYYKDKPIFYSMGNFWFNEKTLESGLLKLELKGDSVEAEPEVTCTIIPAIQEDCVTRYAQSDEDREAVFGLLNDNSINAAVDGETGVVSQQPEDAGATESDTAESETEAA